MAFSAVELSALKVFSFLKVFGLSSFSLKRHQSVTKPLDIFFLFTNISLSGFLLYVLLNYRHLFGASESEIVERGKYVTYIMSFVIDIATMVLYFLNRHKLWKIVQCLSKIDQILISTGVTVDFKKSGVTILVIFSFIMTLAIPVNYFLYYSSKSFFKTIIFIYSGSYFVINIVVLFYFKVETYLRYKGMVRLLEKISGVGSIKRNEKSDIAVISKMIDIYDIFVQTNKTINFVFGGPTLLGFGLSFLYGIFTNFALVKDFIDDGAIEIVTLSAVCFEVFIHVLLFFALYGCELNNKEVENLLKACNKKLKRTDNKMMITMLMSFNSFVERNPPNFSCGLFDFNWGLAYSVSSFFNVFFHLD